MSGENECNSEALLSFFFSLWTGVPIFADFSCTSPLRRLALASFLFCFFVLLSLTSGAPALLGRCSGMQVRVPLTPPLSLSLSLSLYASL